MSGDVVDVNLAISISSSQSRQDSSFSSTRRDLFPPSPKDDQGTGMISGVMFTADSAIFDH